MKRSGRSSEINHNYDAADHFRGVIFYTPFRAIHLTNGNKKNKNIPISFVFFLQRRKWTGVYYMDYRVTHDLIDLQQLNWMEWDGTSGPGGSCLKAEATLSSGKVYYKLSRYEERNGIVGHESVNEIIVDRLLQKLCILCGRIHEALIG